MEILFNWIASAFASGYVSGLSSVGVALSGIAIICYLLYWIGLCLWYFVEDKSIKEYRPSILCFSRIEEETIWKSDAKQYGLSDKEWEALPKGLRHAAHTRLYHREVKDFHPIFYPAAACGFVFVVLVLLGIIIEALLWAPVFFSVVFSSVWLVFLARGVRRLQKKLNKHINTIDAHSASSEQENSNV